MLKKFFTFSRFTLFVALCISAIAAYYSVVGLTAIFAGAVVPIIVMGTILEIAKITTTVWLHRYWDLASWSIKTYLTAAVIALACLTSMGIFGLLSKAHSDTGLVSGDVAARLSIIDEKIKTQRENIDAARKAILQLDEQVNQRLSRGSSEAGAERSVQIRRQQTGERNKLQKEISDAQTVIAKLNEERAPIAAQNRKVEAEVGPIKYIASLIYGDNPDSNLLERAVRWVTILIVIVFDPLAIILILAANNSLKWEEQRRSNETVSPELPTASTLPPSVDTQITDSVTSGLDSLPPIHDPIIEPPPEVEAQQEETIRTFDVEDDDVYSDATNDFDPTTVENSTPWPHIWQEDPVEQAQQEVISENNTDQPEIAVEGVTREAKMYHPADGYVIFEGKNISIAALKELHPELVLSENSPKLEILFGTKFPIAARSGDIYVRIDQIPHVVYKFNGKKWIVLDKNKNTTYLQNIAYIQYMISRLDIGEYDPDYLTPAEQDEISEYLKKSP